MTGKNTSVVAVRLVTDRETVGLDPGYSRTSGRMLYHNRIDLNGKAAIATLRP